MLYASVIHKVHGGIFKVTSPNSSNTVVTRLPSNPSTVQGNPHNIYALKGSNGATELLTTWSVKRTSANGSFVGSGLFKYANNQWQSYGQPPAMDKHTRNVVIDPKNNSIWYVGAFNKYNRFKPSSSNSIYNGTGGGGGIFRFTNNGANWTRITPDSIYRAESIAINPDLFTSEAYVTTANDGIWKTDNVYASSPTFTRVIDFPYSRALRVFYAPDKSVWATTVGGGLFKLDDGRSKIGTVVTVPAGTGSALPITDNSLNPQNHWSNGGDASKRYIDLNLQERHSITNIVYADVWSRQLKISIYDGGATTVVFVSTNPKVNGLSKTNIPIDNILGDRVRIEVTNGNYMQTIEAEVHGAMIEADFTSIQTTPTANQSNIDDGNWTTTWNNGGNPSNAFIGLVLDKKRTVFNVQYTDRWQRKLKIQFYSEGKIVHELTTDTNNANGNPVTTNITVPDIPAGFISIREVGVPNQGVRWMTPTEIDVFGWPE